MHEVPDVIPEMPEIQSEEHVIVSEISVNSHLPLGQPGFNVIADLTEVDMPHNLRQLPGMWKLGHILLHPNSIHIYDLEGQESHSLKVQKQNHQYHNHPYYPWTSANEL